MYIFRKYLIPLVPTVLILAAVTLQNSCANTTQAPSGGKKDTIPPFIVNISPLPGEINIPTKGSRIKFTFNEYVKVKESKNIFLSPPQEKPPRYKIRGKSVVIYFENDLDSNTTYTLDLTNAVVDNNEGNLFPGFTYVFSTGDTIDSMVVTGTVRDCSTLKPVKNATVMLFKDLSDSAVFKGRPNYAVKTDDWGFFAIRGIEDTDYRLYAMQDELGNNKYDSDNDKIAFVDSVIRPKIVARDDLPELLKYDMEDTVKCRARHSEYELLLFRDETSRQVLKNSGRIDDKTSFVSFMAPNAQIDSLWIRNVPKDKLIMEFNSDRDSLLIWINDRRRPLDTLHVFVDYLKTDTTNTLVPQTEHLRLARPGGRYGRKSSYKVKHEDTICQVKLEVSGEIVEQEGFKLNFTQPLVRGDFDSLKLTAVNPRQQRSPMKFRAERDSTNLRSYSIFPEGPLQTGFEYILKVPERVFRDINGFYNDSTEAKVSLPKEDNLSSIILKVDNVSHRYIVELMTEKMDRILRKYTIDKGETLNFPYLKEGKYTIRFTEDINRNGKVDTGNLLERRQPEQVKFYLLKDGADVINLPASTELEQKVDLGKLFKK